MILFAASPTAKKSGGTRTLDENVVTDRVRNHVERCVFIVAESRTARTTEAPATLNGNVITVCFSKLPKEQPAVDRRRRASFFFGSGANIKDGGGTRTLDENVITDRAYAVNEIYVGTAQAGRPSIYEISADGAPLHEMEDART